MSDGLSRLLVITPGIGGRDGVSAFSREVVTGLRSLFPGSPIEVWSMNDRMEGLSVVESRLRSAQGMHARIAWWALREGLWSQTGRLVVVLHAHLAPLSLPLVLRGAKVVQFVLGIEAWKRLTRFEAEAVAKSSRIVAISRHTAVEFHRANPQVAMEAIEVCHPGLAESETLSGEGNENGRSSFALIVGRMSSDERYKGHDTLLEIWSEVAEGLDEPSLLIVGDGDDRPRLEARAIELGLTGKVRFAGKLTDDALAHAYRECAYFVMPSTREGFGLVFLEAMRAGKACVGAVGAAGEIIEDGVTGFLVEPDDRRGLKECLRALFEQPELRGRLGRAGERKFRESFTRERFRSRLEQILTRIA